MGYCDFIKHYKCEHIRKEIYLRKRIAGHEELKTAQERFAARRKEAGHCRSGYKGCLKLPAEGKTACEPCMKWQREYYMRKKMKAPSEKTDV